MACCTAAATRGQRPLLTRLVNLGLQGCRYESKSWTCRDSLDLLRVGRRRGASGVTLGSHSMSGKAWSARGSSVIRTCLTGLGDLDLMGDEGAAFLWARLDRTLIQPSSAASEWLTCDGAARCRTSGRSNNSCSVGCARQGKRGSLGRQNLHSVPMWSQYRLAKQESQSRAIHQQSPAEPGCVAGSLVTTGVPGWAVSIVSWGLTLPSHDPGSSPGPARRAGTSVPWSAVIVDGGQVASSFGETASAWVSAGT